MAWVLGDSSLEALAAANCPGRAAPGSMPGSTAAAPCTGNTGCLSASTSANSCSAQGGALKTRILRAACARAGVSMHSIRTAELFRAAVPVLSS